MSVKKNTQSSSSAPTGCDTGRKARGKTKPAVTMGVRGALTNLLQRGTGKPLDPNYDGSRQYTWTEIAKLLSEQEGINIRRQALRQHVDKLIIEMREKLLKDPHIQDWLIDNGLDKELDRDPSDVSLYEKSDLEIERNR